MPSFLAVPRTRPQRLETDVVIAGLELVLRLVAHTDWSEETPAEFGDVVVFVGRDWVLVPVEAEVVRRASHVQRLAKVVAVVGVEHKLHIVANDVPHARHHLEDGGGVHDTRVYLVGAESGGAYLMRLSEVTLRGLVSRRVGGVNLGLVAAGAEQLVHGNSGGLARDVPQCHVHGGPGVHAQSAPSAEDGQTTPQAFALERVAAKYFRA